METRFARWKHANSSYTKLKRDSVPQPWMCEAISLPTEPLSASMAWSFNFCIIWSFDWLDCKNMVCFLHLCRKWRFLGHLRVGVCLVGSSLLKTAEFANISRGAVAKVTLEWKPGGKTSSTRRKLILHSQDICSFVYKITRPSIHPSWSESLRAWSPSQGAYGTRLGNTLDRILKNPKSVKWKY